jgi:hypothetical protein
VGLDLRLHQAPSDAEGRTLLKVLACHRLLPVDLQRCRIALEIVHLIRSPGSWLDILIEHQRSCPAQLLELGEAGNDGGQHHNSPVNDRKISGKRTHLCVQRLGIFSNSGPFVS